MTSRVECLNGSSVLVRNVNADLKVATANRPDIWVRVSGPTRLVDGLSIRLDDYGCVVIDNDAMVSTSPPRLSFWQLLRRCLAGDPTSVVANGPRTIVAGGNITGNAFGRNSTVNSVVTVRGRASVSQTVSGRSSQQINISGSNSGLKITIQVPPGVRTRVVNVNGTWMG